MKLLTATGAQVLLIVSLGIVSQLPAAEPLEISGHGTTGPGGWDVTVSARQDTNGISGFVSVLGGATGPAIQIVAPTDDGCGCWCINARRTDTEPGTDQRINVYIRDVGDGIASFDQFQLVSGIGIDCSFPSDDLFFQPFRQGDFTASQGLNAAPVATWVQPFDSSVFAEGNSIILTAQASDSDGTVSFVDFYAGARQIGRVNGPSADGIYNFTWANPPLGHVQLHAVAVDNAGARGISGSVEIFVGNGNSEPLDLGTVEVPSIGHSFSGFGPGPVPPGPIHYSVTDYLIDQDQRSGGGAVLPSVSVNWDTNSQFTLTVFAPAGHKFHVQVPSGQPVGFGGELFWESTRGGESPFGPVSATFAGLEGTAPEFISADAVLSSSHGYFGFSDLSSATVSNDFSFTSVTLTGTVTPQHTGNGSENYVPHLNSSFVLYHSASEATDPGRFVSIVPVPSPEATPSGAISVLAQRISDSTYPTRIKRPLVNALVGCCNSVDSGKRAEAVDMLRAFQRKVAVQLARDPRTARELVNAAQRIIDSLPSR